MSSVGDLDGLTLEDKAARLFWIVVHGRDGDAPHPANRAAYGVDTPAQVVRRYQPGGVVLFSWAGNTEHPTQIAQLTRDLRSAATTEAWGVAIDEEGGRVSRLQTPATVFPSARAVAAADDALALDRWRAGAVELAALGVTADLAPVTDLGNPLNPVLGDRTFGDDPETVAHHAALAVRGLQTAGVAAVAKHFPGHGATAVDSHDALPVVSLSRPALDRHLDAFRRLLTTEPPAGVMTAHLLVRALDERRPATLSPAVLTGLLREDMRYGGAVVTDSLSMAGIRTGAGDAEVAVAALAAGADVLLLPPDLPGAVRAVCDAVRRGRLQEERVHDALLRAAPLCGAARVPSDGLTARVDFPRHRAVAAEIARRALRVADPAGLLPLVQRPVVVAGAQGSGARALADALRLRGRDATLLEASLVDPPAVGLEAAGQTAASRSSMAPPHPALLAAALPDATVVLVRRFPELDGRVQDAVLRPLAERCVVVVETGTTPALWHSGARIASVRTWGASTPSMQAAADALVGAPGPP